MTIPPARSWLGLALLMIAGIGSISAGIFPTELTPPYTISSTIHDWAAFIAFAAIVIAMLVIPRKLRMDPQWRLLWSPLFKQGLAALAILIFNLLVLTLNLPILGLAERVLLIPILLWVMLVASHLRALALVSRDVAT
jgi:hypothetical membrane protein